MQNILIVFISFLFGCLGAWIIHKIGYKLGVLDVPNERSSHTKDIPKGGGIGILAAFVFSSIIIKIPITFWVPALVLSIVSFFGDKVELSVKFRLLIQFICSFIFLINFFYSAQVHLLTWFLIFPFAVFIVGTSNFYNFMDGINGIAGVTGAVGFFLLAFYGYISGAVTNYNVLAIAVVFACTGFLLFNIPKAKVFMGDIGSVLLGFVFACMVVSFSRTLLEFIFLVGFLFPFYADELITMFVRIRNGDSLNIPHRQHIYQLLANEYEIEHWKVSTAYGVIQLAIGMAIIFLQNYSYIPVIALLLMCFFCSTVFAVVIRKKLTI
ncbi:MAG: glycosyltransferase family 4 protein [Desulfobacterales bacterium]|nr:glycosyltransferase family 4 protein [Desulfobacterales bacterium]